MPTIPTVFDKRACSFGEWYPRFRQHTWSSVVIPLAPAFIRYLDQDSVIIPESSAPPRPQRRSSEDSDGFSEDEDEELAASQLDPEVMAELSTMEKKINDVIVELGGEVIVKFNWSAPKDAKWINANTLKCRSAGDVLMLLKSSNNIAHDLESLRAAAVSPILVLRRWRDINLATEFRAFIRDGKLIAMCQRNVFEMFDELAASREQYKAMLLTFFNDSLRPSLGQVSCVIDLYISSRQRVYVEDFDIFDEQTDALLFAWPELRTMPIDGDAAAELRIVTAAQTINRPSVIMMHGQPEDLRNVTIDELIDSIRSTNLTADQ